MASVGLADELFERVFDLIGEVEQELGLSLDVGEGSLELDRGAPELGRFGSRLASSGAAVGSSSSPRGSVALSMPLFAGLMAGLPCRARVGRSVDDGFEGRAHIADEPHVLAFLPQIGGVHLDKLPDEDPRAGIAFGLVAVGIGQGGADQIIHELELTANRNTQPGKLGLLGGFWFRSELRHPDCVPNQRLDARFCKSVRAGCPFRAATPGFAEGPPE